MLTLEQKLAFFMMGTDKASALMTDGYKFSMAQAGFPLRREGFVSSQRKGGPYYIPFDVKALIEALLPAPATGKEAAFLQATGYGLNTAMEEALRGKVDVQGAPKGSWVLGKEPLHTTFGHSLLVSWLEPFDIMMNFSIQVATALKQGAREFDASCEDEAGIIYALAEDQGLTVKVTVKLEEYRKRVKENLDRVSKALKGDMHRVFEVGMRAATCMQQHRECLKICRANGVNKTSNVFLAWELYMVPVGTTGHEHQERWGADIDGFRAIRDMRSEPPSYLFDTYDPIRSGIPAALKALKEDPSRKAFVRFDSGDQVAQLQILVKAALENAHYIFEDGYDDLRIAEMEGICQGLGLPSEKCLYGLGGFLVSQPSPNKYQRDLVSAVYKLCFSVVPRRKKSGTPGKDSLPGDPVIFRPSTFMPLPKDGPDGIIGQYGEEPPDGYTVVHYYGASAWDRWLGNLSGRTPIVTLSPATAALRESLNVETEKIIGAGH
jgi:nicotinic acid phosphoribosyltransferase